MDSILQQSIQGFSKHKLKDSGNSATLNIAFDNDNIPKAPPPPPQRPKPEPVIKIKSRVKNGSIPKDSKPTKKKKSRKAKLADIAVVAPAKIDHTLPSVAVVLRDQTNSPSLLGFIYVIAILNAMDFSLVLPTMYPLVSMLGGDMLTFALVFATHNVFELLSSIPIGKWLDMRPVKEVLIVCATLSFIGNIFYISSVHTNKIYMLFIGRCIAGLGAGIGTAGYAHIARNSSQSNRESRISMYRWLETNARVLAPAIGAGASYMGSFHFGLLVINGYTIGSSIAALLFFIFLLFVFSTFFFKSKIESGLLALFGRDAEEEKLIASDSYSSHVEHRFLSCKGVIYLIFYFGLIFTFWAFIACLIPTTSMNEKFVSPVHDYLLFLFIGGVFLVSFGIYRFAGLARFSNNLIIFSALFMLAGSVALTTFDTDYPIIPIWQLLIATAFLVIGFAFGTLQLPVIYSQLIGARIDDLGMKMSWWFSMGNLGVALGPVVGVLLFQINGLNLVAHGCSVIVLIILVLAFILLASKNTTEQVPSPPINSAEISLLSAPYSIDSQNIFVV